MYKEFTDDEKVAIIKRDIEEVTAKLNQLRRDENKTFLLMTPTEIFDWQTLVRDRDRLLVQLLEDTVELNSKKYRDMGGDYLVTDVLVDLIKKGLSIP